MRAARLLSLLLLLQTRGRLTAEALAAELEVSQRTIYRYIDALSSAGVPVYGERGPEGGYALLDGYRTTLTGLTADEMRAFFMLNIPAPLTDLGLGQELKAALLKLTAALPTAQRQEEERVRQRFHLDADWWAQGDEPAPHVRTIQQAVWDDRLLRISYRVPQGVEIEQVVQPYGLVAKAGVWYLVYRYAGRMRARRVSHLQQVQVLAETFARLPDVDLAAFWQTWCAAVEEERSSYQASLRVAPDFAPYQHAFFGEGARAAGDEAAQPDAQGWIGYTVSFESFCEARGRILACGRGVMVIAPEELRLSVIDYASQVVDLYEHDAR